MITRIDIVTYSINGITEEETARKTVYELLNRQVYEQFLATRLDIQRQIEAVRLTIPTIF
ncbi:hypothetical protein H6F93_01460 [Leptolyngbya sp. FACHB-671]|uniref:hypothetical protein n=1 Tax=Leptolyngbya sp. FACHB-671 TaxID=2692812 RepID=UPI001682E383|nr:hypothetical protein [Leptolyngbya sp. FACHB-671]MBD2066206.1 hypothetical protein [Leptolyngbya sp. FACHB-671]